MAKQNKFKEDEGTPIPPKGGDGGGGGATPDHADEDQDKALFAKMIKQYLGKDDADESEMEIAKHAYQAHKEKGLGDQEAYEAAGTHIKMAAEIGKKMHQAKMKASESESEGEGESEGECKQSEDEGESESEGESEGESEKHESQKLPPGVTPGKKEKKHEAASVAKLAGEVAKLRESLKSYEIKDYLEAKLKKSGESNSCTKLFREALGKPRSIQHIDETWNTFIKAYKAGAKEVDSENVFFMEKNTYRDDGVEKKSFVDCLR
jgi:hypothetical protein